MTLLHLPGPGGPGAERGARTAGWWPRRAAGLTADGGEAKPRCFVRR